MIIRLIREVNHPGNSGPCNGQYALQRALRARNLPWLKIGGRLRDGEGLRDGEVPWIWCWKDREMAAALATAGRPFVLGPNVLFADSRRPCSLSTERKLCRAASCRLMFTESAWYGKLIERHRGPQNRAPLVVWPYPIDPKPGGPLPAEYDLLIYAKSGYDDRLLRHLQQGFPRTKLLVYGRFRREELFAAARRSRCCVYLSDDDRGPLALAEILLSGCPAVGVPHGAPFIVPGRTGALLNGLELDACMEGVRQCHAMNRKSIADVAAKQFDTEEVVDVVLGALWRCATQTRNRGSGILDPTRP